jgi:hypothetical protein
MTSVNRQANRRLTGAILLLKVTEFGRQNRGNLAGFSAFLSIFS